MALALALSPPDFVSQLRNDLEEIAHRSKVGELEDRCVGILVYGDYRVCRLHAHPMLNGPRYADCDIHLRFYRFPRLSDLVRIADPSRVDSRSRGSDDSAELRCQLLEHGERLGAAQSATARHNDRC